MDKITLSFQVLYLLTGEFCRNPGRVVILMFFLMPLLIGFATKNTALSEFKLFEGFSNQLLNFFFFPGSR